MKALKSIIPIVLILFLIFPIMGLAFADDDGMPITNETPIIRPIDPITLFNGYITVEFNKKTAHVGDTVLITVTANNNGLVDWCPLVIYAPIPDGLKYVSHVVPDKTRQDYNYETGIWDVNRMRCDERGLLKTIVITTKVLPEAEGKTLEARARFNTLVLEGYDIHMEHTEYIPDATPDTLTVLSTNNGPGPGDGPGNGTGNKTGDGNDLINSDGNSKLAAIMSNFTNPGDENNPLLDLQTGGGGGNGKTYEVTNATNQNPQTPTNTTYTILGVLILVALVTVGYFKGMRND